MANKKIAIISSSFPPYGGGGISSAHYNLFKILKDNGYDAKVFTFGDDGIIDKDTDEVVRSGMPSWMKKICLFIFWVIKKIFRKHIKFIGWHTLDVFLSLYGAFFMTKKVEKFEPNVIIIPDHGCPGFFIKKKNNVLNILISHHNPSRFYNIPFVMKSDIEDIKLTLKFENIALEKIDKVICPSKYMQNEFNKTYKLKKEIEVIPNIVDSGLINNIIAKDMKKELGLTENAVLIYIPAAGSVFKGSRFVFEIIRRLSYKRQDYEIAFFLSGTLSEELKEEFNFMDKRVKLFCPGHLSYHENISVIKSCSFAISPTLIESFGMALLEAVFCGMPVVAFDVGGDREIIINEKNGYLVPFLDIEQLINCSERLIEDNVLREQMGKNSLLISKRFSEKVILEKYKKILSVETCP
ncbi:glycosyltransferase family 4 protein [Anaerosinus massiliensis]|uniref:glycosyltransferase family 4 protein n=1 Tax=Massilibacillus massiliensis TaxID=1806837 RepID=UPI000DA5EDA7|nr:glycosyltransferase family 4 protein [Massilibacillus massiliensis]